MLHLEEGGKKLPGLKEKPHPNNNKRTNIIHPFLACRGFRELITNTEVTSFENVEVRTDLLLSEHLKEQHVTHMTK